MRQQRGGLSEHDIPGGLRRQEANALRSGSQVIRRKSIHGLISCAACLEATAWSIFMSSCSLARGVICVNRLGCSFKGNNGAIITDLKSWMSTVKKNCQPNSAAKVRSGP